MEKNIGFIGIGVMGKSMASNLMDAGYTLHIYTRTKSKADDLIAKGAVWQDSIKDIAENCDVVMTMVGYPSDVEDVYFNSDYGILNHHKGGAILIDFTTSTPSLAEKIYDAAKKSGANSIDAPVSGGDIGAKNAALTIMCGGDQDVFDKCVPMFEKLGKNVVLQGGAGCGQHCKMSNQIAIAASMVGMCESIAYAKKAGLDPETVLKSISAGSAGSWSLSNYTPRILKDDFEPGFYIKHFVKDMKIALDEAKRMNLDLPGLALAKSLYETLENDGLGDNGTQALFKWYQRQL